MARIASIATALPAHRIHRTETRAHAARVFGPAQRGAGHLLEMIDRTGIDYRHLCTPVEEIIRERPLDERSRDYQRHALALGLQAVNDALARAELSPDAIDHLITVSCTGVMIPSLDAEIMNVLPFRRDCRRTPITELGCAAGAVALSRAWQQVRAHPGSTVLVVAVELSSLTFQPQDTSMTNVVASTIFADGAAAVVITGRPGRGAHIVDARSELFPATQHIMGFDLKSSGFHIKLDRALVPLLEREFTGVVERFLTPHGLTERDLRFFALHPGGRRLLEVMEERLGAGRDATQASWDVLRDYGNMSSATVLFVLDRALRTKTPSPGDRGLLAAFGPGFSAETVLLEWH